MFKLIVIFSSYYIIESVSGYSAIYHVGSKITFSPDQPSEYFGYSVVISPTGLLVGAPKARSRVKPTISPGLVFNCSTENLDVLNVTCNPLTFDDGRMLIHFSVRDFFRDDMWFGATIAVIPNGKLFICAPRWANPFKDSHLLSNGACYVQAKNRGASILPLKETNFQAYKVLDLSRREYGDYGSNLNYYAYGQAGMSVNVVGNQSVIIGAPGLLQWAGGVLDFRYDWRPNSIFFSKQESMNPFYTKDLRPDDYFGYSVESGKFDVNGKTLYVAGAPRANFGYGMVLLFDPPQREKMPLNIIQNLRGPQLGSYFGASLLCIDINGDGSLDLLVGAPNFVKKEANLPYDQGAVFIYLNKKQSRGFILQNASYVSGSGKSGSRFGTSIADLGDINGDGFTDVAIGAPWEDGGAGAVYIYLGCEEGLKSTFLQRIMAEGAMGFGYSISRGFDIDKNNCTDLSVGAFKSSNAYIYRCIPTIQVYTSIIVPDKMSLPQNATNYTTFFCVTVPSKPDWMHVKVDFKATIIVDSEEKRASISGESQYTVTARPGRRRCDEQLVKVKPHSDLTKPISMKLILEPITFMEDNSDIFLKQAARISEDSMLKSSFDIQLAGDCGEDLTCFPWLELSIQPLFESYIPGADTQLGAKIIVINKEEPAYGAKLNITLPLPPLRVPSSCTLRALNMTCNLPAPLSSHGEVNYEIELDYSYAPNDAREMFITALLEDPIYTRIISDGKIQTLKLNIEPHATFTINCKSLPNTTVFLTREKYEKYSSFSFVHYFEVYNHGPSDWSMLRVRLHLLDKINLTQPIKGCDLINTTLECQWFAPAKVSKPIVLPLRLDTNAYGDHLYKYERLDVTTTIELLPDKGINGTTLSNITTTFLLEHRAPMWYVFVAPLAGLLILASLVYLLYRYGFFSRQYQDRLKKLKRETMSVNEDSNEPSASGSQPPVNLNESTDALLLDESD